MSNVISKLGMVRVGLIFFILLCVVFTSENALSRRHWENYDLKVTYSPKKEIMKFELLFYDYLRAPDEHAYLESSTISYSENGNTYTSLMKVSTKNKKGKKEVPIQLWYKKYNEKIHVMDKNRTENFFNIWNDLQVLNIKGCIKRKLYVDGTNILKSERSYLIFKWFLPQSGIQIKTVKITGLWKTNDESGGDKIGQVYTVVNVNSNTKTLKNTPSEMNSEIIDKMKVTGKTDAIIVTGAKPGEYIKVYTGSGVEVKSFVANDDVLNIKLPSNQIYIVKAGQARYKVAL